MARSLFILKRREDYSDDPSYGNSYQIATGMWNSAMFVVEALRAQGKDAEIEMVIDANFIDASVTTYNPSHVFIEGLWVTPTKLAELMALPRHAGRTWVIRIHSEIPFLAVEGVAMEWIADYLRLGAVIAPNAPRVDQQLRVYARAVLGLPTTDPVAQVKFLPNCYPTVFEPLPTYSFSKPTLDVACFGAFRPLKNHLQQVFIAARFAQQLGKDLRFHINSRADAGGQGPKRNTEEAITELGFEVVDHGWEDRETFLQSLRDVDLLMQVSMSETFNIVAADATLVGTPVLASSEISWAYPLFADPQRVDDCLSKLTVLWGRRAFFVQGNRRGLKAFANQASRIWNSYV